MGPAMAQKRGSVGEAAWRGAGAGAVLGLVALGAEMVVLGSMTVQNRITPGLGLLVGQLGVALLLGALLGTLAGVLLGAARARHLVAVAGGWAAVTLWVAPASTGFRLRAAAYALAALLAVLLGRRLRARFPRGVPAVAAAALAVVFLGPVTYLRLSTPAPPAPAPATAAPPGAPDVVVVVLDTVRADHVSAYGYARPTTPHFDALARGGALFLDATAPSTWSLPSHASLFTGLFPSVHRAHDEHRFLDAGAPTLAEILGAAGWDTRCFTANAWISDNLGLTRGFAWQDEAWRAGRAGRSFTSMLRLLDHLGLGVDDKGGALVASNFEAWLAGRPPDAPPAFAFLNFIEAHFPYHQLPAGYLTRFTDASPAALRALSLRLFAAQFGGDPVDPAEAAEAATAMYDAGVLYADALLGRVAAALERRGSLDRTVLVVLSDHGELLGERGEFGHGQSLYEPVTRVPLLVRHPPRVPAGVRVETPVSTVGVFATVLDLLGLAEPGRLHVGSLVPVIEGRPGGGPVLAERYANHLIGGRGGEGLHPLMRPAERFRSYRVGPLKLIETTASGAAFLFDLAADPGEERDVAAARPGDLARLHDELATWRRALGLPALDAPVDGEPAPPLDPAARERLRALGYVE
jgi:arylsulfatase A-like enzyme